MDKKLTLKQKDKIVKSIYKTYQRAQLDILYLSQHYNHYPQLDLFKVKEKNTLYKKGDTAFLKHIERKQDLETFVSIVNQIHTHLSKDCYSFLENEYLNYCDSNWWYPLFSKASYYRLKHRSLDEMLEYTKTFWDDNDLYRLLG